MGHPSAPGTRPVSPTDVADDQREAGGAHRQPGQVGADGHDVVQQALQRRGDGELAQRLGQLAAPDAQALGAGREVARDRVDARVQARDLLHQHAVVDAGEQSAAVAVPGRQATARQPAAGVDLNPPAPPSRSRPCPCGGRSRSSGRSPAARRRR